MKVGIFICHRVSNWQHTWIQGIPRRRFTWQKVLNFPFVSGKRWEKKGIRKVNLIFIVNMNMTLQATGYFVIHQTLIFSLGFGISFDTIFFSLPICFFDVEWIICNMCASLLLLSAAFFVLCWNVIWLNCQECMAWEIDSFLIPFTVEFANEWFNSIAVRNNILFGSLKSLKFKDWIVSYVLVAKSFCWLKFISIKLWSFQRILEKLLTVERESWEQLTKRINQNSNV